MFRVNIALRVPKIVEQEAIAVAVSLAKSKENYSFLDGITSLPHVTLYAPVVKEENIAHVLDAIEKVASDSNSLYLTLKEKNHSQGFVGIEFGLTPDIKMLQEKIISVVLPYTEKDVLEKFAYGKDYHMEFSPGSLQSLEKYGSVGVINIHPHLTLFRLKNDIDAELAERKVKWSIPRFLVNAVGIFIMGDFGVCQELVATFPLKTS